MPNLARLSFALAFDHGSLSSRPRFVAQISAWLCNSARFAVLREVQARGFPSGW